jgi:hypothetical protein
VAPTSLHVVEEAAVGQSAGLAEHCPAEIPTPGLLAAQIDNMLTVSVAGAYGLSVDQETNFWTNKQLRCFARHRPSSFDTTATQSAVPPLFSSRSVDSIDCVSTTHRIASHRASKPTAGDIAYHSR